RDGSDALEHFARARAATRPRSRLLRGGSAGKRRVLSCGSSSHNEGKRHAGVTEARGARFRASAGQPVERIRPRRIVPFFPSWLRDALLGKTPTHCGAITFFRAGSNKLNREYAIRGSHRDLRCESPPPVDQRPGTLSAALADGRPS